MAALLDVSPRVYFSLKMPAIHEVDERGSLDWLMMPGEFEVLLRAHEPLGSTWLEAINGLAMKCMTKWNRLPRRVLLTKSGLDELKNELRSLVRFRIKVPPLNANSFRLGTAAGAVEVSEAEKE